MKKQSIHELLTKYLNNSISNEEVKILETFLQDSDNIDYVKEILRDDHILENATTKLDSDGVYERLMSSIGDEKPRKVVAFKPWYRYAAAVVVLLGLTFLAKEFIGANVTEIPLQPVAVKEVRLILDDGSELLLNSEQIDSVRNKRNHLVGYGNQKSLNYVVANEEKNELQYNTVEVPYGKTFDLVLSDGSTVAMNSGSSLRYPVAFPKTGDREVFLEGEAFFKVAKDKGRKFMLETKEVKIQVLGTEFNVTAYPDDDKTVTSLQEGAVKVFDTNNFETPLLLTPNEQAVWDKQFRSHDKKEVSPYDIGAWRRNQLVFKQQSFDEILRIMERRFDVRIENNNKQLGKKRFTANFYEKNAEQILAYFQNSIDFEYEVKNQKITIE